MTEDEARAKVQSLYGQLGIDPADQEEVRDGLTESFDTALNRALADEPMSMKRFARWLTRGRKV